jgi:hypothetical protein
MSRRLLGAAVECNLRGGTERGTDFKKIDFLKKKTRDHIKSTGVTVNATGLAGIPIFKKLGNLASRAIIFRAF